MAIRQCLCGCAIALILIHMSGPVFSDTVLEGAKWNQGIGKKGTACRPNDNGKKVFEEKLEDGYKLELWCQNGFFQLKVILPDGTVGYAGKCPYPLGQNELKKYVKGDLHIKDHGTPTASITAMIPKKLLRTTYTSYDAPCPPTQIPPTGTAWQEHDDSEWEYDTTKPKKLKKSATKHKGRWMPPATPGGRPEYEVKETKKSGTIEVNLPSTPAQLSIGAHVPEPPSGEMVIGATGYAMSTPLPVAATIDGEDATVAVRVPLDGNSVIIERIAANADTPFIYDIDFPDESAGHVFYMLLDGPNGMTVGEHNGLIRWTPSASQVGMFFDVVIGYSFIGQSGHIDRFTIPVLPANKVVVDRVYEGATDPVEVVFPPGSVNDVQVGVDGSIELLLASYTEGTLEIAIPRELLDAQENMVNIDFDVRIDDVLVRYEELEGYPGTRILRIPIPKGENIRLSIHGN